MPISGTKPGVLGSSGSAPANPAAALLHPDKIVIATFAATAQQKLSAHYTLPDPNSPTGTCAVINGAFTTATPVVELIGGGVAQLDGELLIQGVDYARLHITDRVVLQARANQGSTGTGTSGASGTVSGAINVRGAAPAALTLAGLTGTLGLGERIIAHAQANLPSQIAKGDWLQIQSNEVHNYNRPLQFFKGEFVKVEAVSASTLTLAGPLRDSYDTTQIVAINKLSLCKSPEIQCSAGGKIQSHPTSTSAYGQLVQFQDCFNAQAFEVLVDGNAGSFASIGVGFWRSLQSRAISPRLERIGDFKNASAPLGYGIYVAGGQGSYISNLYAFECRHAIDFGTGGNNTYGQSRDGLVSKGVAIHTWAAGFSTHDAENITFSDCISLACGGGFITRSPQSKFIRCTVRGVHQDDPSSTSNAIAGYGSQSTGHAFYVGEPDVAQTTTAGRGGESLVIEDPDIDLRQGSGAIVVNGFHCIDPLVGARITGKKPAIVTGLGFYSLTAYNIGLLLRMSFDGTYQPGSGTKRGVHLECNAASTTLLKQNSDIEIDIRVNNMGGAAVWISDGQGQTNGTMAPSNNIKIKAQVLSLGSGTTQGSPQVTFGGGGTPFNFSDVEVELDAPLTQLKSAFTGLTATTLFSGFKVRNSRFLNGVKSENCSFGVPASGQHLQPTNYISSITAITPASGTPYFTPLRVGRMTSVQKIAHSVGVAEALSGGATIHLVCIWPDRGDLAGPDFTQPMLAAASIPVSATGVTQANYSVMLPPGDYWVGSLYNLNGATATTQFTVVPTNNTTALLAGGGVGSLVKGLVISTTMTAFPTTNTDTLTPVVTNVIPTMSVQAT